MDDDSKTSKAVAHSIQNAIQDDSLTKAVFEFGETRILFSKGHQLGGAPAELKDAPDYPEVPIRGEADDEDTWLK